MEKAACSCFVVIGRGYAIPVCDGLDDFVLVDLIGSVVEQSGKVGVLAADTAVHERSLVLAEVLNFANISAASIEHVPLSDFTLEQATIAAILGCSECDQHHLF